MKNIININKIFLKCCSAALLILFIATLSFAGNAPDRRTGKIPPNIQSLAPVNNIFMQANNLNTCIRSDGIFNYDKVTYTSSIAGLIWPVTVPTRLACDYATGIWIGAKVGGDLRTAVSLYNSIFTPGNIPVVGAVPPASVCGDPKFKAYHVSLSDPNLINGGSVNKIAGGHTYVVTYDPWSTWPVDLGAPYVEVNGIPGYQPGPGGDRPGIGNSDATPDDIVFCSFMDYSNCTNNIHNHEISLPGGTLPLGVEIHQVAFAFNSPGLQDMYFNKFWIINKSANRWDSTYSCIVNDVDLGNAADDAAGCDSAVSLGFIYNATNFDLEYGAAPPATGSKYLQGPLIYTGNLADIVYLPYDTLIGYQEMGMTGFNVFDNVNDACLGDPDNAIAGYNFMKGFNGCGVPAKNWVKGNYETHYIYNTDSTAGYCSGNRLGWFDSVGSDRRFIQASGPFTMNSTDTQVVVIGIFVDRGGSNVSSVCKLIQNSTVVQSIYNRNFHAIPLPVPPKVQSVADGNGNITLYWGDTSEFYHTYDFIDSTGFWTFQGYEVYQIRPGTGGDNASDRTLLAVYDVIDSIDINGQHVYDSILVAQPNGETQVEYIPVTYGLNTGVSRIISLTHNAYPNGVNDFFINGQNYKFSVVAYGVNTGINSHGHSSIGFKVLKNAISAQQFTVTPNYPVMGSNFINKDLDTLVSNRTDRSFLPVIVDPKKVITARYQMVWQSDTSWNVVRIMNSQVDTLGKQSLNMSAFDNRAFVFDGIIFKADSILKVNFGVIKDPGAGAQTSSKGWTYTGGALNLQGVDTSVFLINPSGNYVPMQSMSMGLSWFTGNNFKRSFTSKIDTNYLKTYTLPRIRLNFGSTQKAYRYLGALNNAPYKDYVDVPFTVEMFDPLDSAMTTPRQLNCAFYDHDSSGTWNPQAKPDGGFEILYIFASNYSSTPNAFYPTKNINFQTHFKTLDVYYAWWPRLINAGPAFTNGDVLNIIPYTKLRHYATPGFVTVAEVSTTAPTIGNISLAQTNGELQNIRVVPNPYYGGHSQETSSTDRFVKFMRMPKTATIFIYSLNGNLVRKLVKDDNTTTINWDLLNTDALPVASGIYIAYINAPGIGTRVIKLAIFTPEERLQSF